MPPNARFPAGTSPRRCRERRLAASGPTPRTVASLAGASCNECNQTRVPRPKGDPAMTLSAKILEDLSGRQA